MRVFTNGGSGNLWSVIMLPAHMDAETASREERRVALGTGKRVLGHCSIQALQCVDLERIEW